jgi:Tol biopolymer transport system component
MKLARGSRLGPYEIVAPIGAGGMGEVYRARDTRLDRSVAIKVLPAELSDNAQLRQRFEREARTISALSHPHICTLHDIGRENGIDFLVMEYLEGETLSEKLRKGPLPLAQVLRYGIEIAEALDKAHRHGIIHRDLKPSNIMLTKSGLKLLDFGLAKSTAGQSLWDAAKSKLSQQPTAQKPLTAEGTLVGTLEYMAPEQLEGKEPDARTDIFALGNVLYRMATGKKPFEGSSDASLIASILEHEPEPITAIQPMTPPSLDRLVRSCLAKSPEERIQTAHDLMLQLSWIAEGASDPARAMVVAPPRSWRWLVWPASFVAAVVLVTLVALKLNPRPTARSTRYLNMTLPSTAPVTLAGGYEVLTVSRDGKRLAYVSESSGHRQIFLRHIDRPKAEPVPGTEGAEVPFFSPDGRWIGFSAPDNTLKKISLEGGSAIKICDARRPIRGATWGSDDIIVFGGANLPLHRVSASGGTPEPLFKTTKNVRWPVLLPGGKHLLYTVAPDISGNYDAAEVAVLSLETGQSHSVVKGGVYARYASGHLLYFSSGTLFAVPFDLRRMRTAGGPKPILEDVMTASIAGLAFYDVSSDGTIFYLPVDPGMDQRELLWVDRSGKSSPVVTQRRNYADSQLSPDQQSIIVTIQDQSLRADLWMYEIARDAWTRVTTEANNYLPVWSPDGTRFVFASNRSGPYNLFVMASDLASPPKQIIKRQDWSFPNDWSPDGKLISVGEQTRTTGFDIWFVSLEPAVEMKPFLVTSANESNAAFSPDGRWVAYQSDASGQMELYVVSADGRGRKWMVSNEGGTQPQWNPDGNELFYRKEEEIMSVEIRTVPRFEAGKPRVLFKGLFDSFDVTPGGKRFLMVRREPQVPRTQVNVVQGMLRQ